MWKEKTLGRYTFIYRHPRNLKWHYIFYRGLNGDPVVSIGRVAIWRHKKKR